MASPRVLFPGPGCVVECMQGNKPLQYWVLEVSGESARILSASGRESKMNISRLLPWHGPQYSPEKSRQEIASLLSAHGKTREGISQSLDIMHIWETAQGEVERVSAAWLAELAWEKPDADQVAAMGHAALVCKTHFKFSPPEFDVYDGDTVAKKLADAEAANRREEFASTGGEFFRVLWGIHTGARGPLREEEIPPAHFAQTLADMIRHRISHPESHEGDSDPRGDAAAWKLLTKSLPDDPHLPLHLAVAWGLVPPHHNFWLDRAGYETGHAWTEPYSDELLTLARAVEEAGKHAEEAGEDETATFISIDPARTADVDDAFTIVKNPDGSFTMTLAFASPAQFWPYGSPFDKAILRRASSLYLPEGDHHMMPRDTALGLFSLLAHKRRPASLVDITLSPEGDVSNVTPRLGWLRIAANLSLPGVQAVLENLDVNERDPHTDHAKLEEGLHALHADEGQVVAAAPFAAQLHAAMEMADLLQKKRVAAGAVITDKPEAEVTLHTDEDGETVVSVCHAPHTPSAQTLVGEMMILANTALARWAKEREIPIFYRTQDVALPKEFAGVWTDPLDIARIVKHLPPSTIETSPRPHAGLGAPVYAPLTSPIRRYSDLVNMGQIISFLQTGTARYSKDDLDAMLPYLSAASEAAAQVQRFRPRYWKLLFYKQMGDKIWWDAIVTEENDLYARLSLPLTQISLRTRRKVLGDKVYEGQEVKVRIGKVNPLRNEIQVLAAVEG